MLFLVAVLGLIIGSFLNVLIFREGTDEGVGGRSHCQHCFHTLSAIDLVPVFSWMFLRGRCRYCGVPISIQYPLVELITAASFVVIAAASLSITASIVAMLLVSICIAIAAYDIKYMLIPNSWNYIFMFSALSLSLLQTSIDVISIGTLLVAGPLTALPLWALWAYSGGRWMGFGDVMYAVGMGWLLGPYYGFVSLMFAFVIGAIVSVCILLPLGRVLSYAHAHGYSWLSGADAQFTMGSEVPFGPFLIVSCLFVWFSTLYGISLPLVL